MAFITHHALSNCSRSARFSRAIRAIRDFARTEARRIIVATTTYTLTADAGIRDISELWVGVRAALDAANPQLELDAEAVTRPDTALAQLLAGVVVRAREEGKSVRIVRASQRLRELISLLALDVVLGD